MFHLRIVTINFSYVITTFQGRQCLQTKEFPQPQLRPDYCENCKVVQVINALVLFSLITSEIFQLTHRYRYQSVGEVMVDM